MRDIPACDTTSSAFEVSFSAEPGRFVVGKPLTANLLSGLVLIFLVAALLTGFNPVRA